MTKVHRLSALIAVSALLALSAPPAPDAAPPSAPAATPGVISRVQTVLRNEGAYHLSVTGRENSATALALRNWQHKHNIPETGIIDSATLRSMNIR